MKMLPNQTEFLIPSEADTLGIVVDLSNMEGRNLAEETLRQTNDPELNKLITMADELGKKYIIAAGQFNGKGISSVICDDDSMLIAAFRTVNERMREIGSQTTVWLIKPDACVTLLEKAIAQRAKKKRWQR
ncbi:MAG: hypothetical protein EBU46_07860 [Nitrosomonadaceae bacterium]|nr:hypothetical protein [Nitrosomonadaceae bacterium]